jgi:hypothetical protein
MLRAPERLAGRGGGDVVCDFGDTSPHLGRADARTVQAGSPRKP